MAESYLNQGQLEVWFVETLTNPAAPTKAQIELGEPLARFARTSPMPSSQDNSVDATPVGAKDPSSLSGMPSVTNASIQFLIGDTASAESVQLFQSFRTKRGTSGYLVYAPLGRVGATDDEDGEVTTGDLVHVFPAKVGVTTIDSVGPQDPQTATTSFSHSGAWHPAVVVVAS